MIAATIVALAAVAWVIAIVAWRRRSRKPAAISVRGGTIPVTLHRADDGIYSKTRPAYFYPAVVVEETPNPAVIFEPVLDFEPFTISEPPSFAGFGGGDSGGGGATSNWDGPDTPSCDSSSSFDSSSSCDSSISGDNS